MDPEALTKLRCLIGALQEVYHLQKVIFFSSRARGDHPKYSDVDLILVSDDFEGVFFPDRATRIYDYWEGGLPLEVLCYTPAEFERKKQMIGLVREAVREGVSLLG